MKTKQLANVLIKVLGLSLVVHDIPTLVSAIVDMYQVFRGSESGIGILPLTAIIILLTGIFLIAKSRDTAEILFKGDDE